jgi:hypothetical protein
VSARPIKISPEERHSRPAAALVSLSVRCLALAGIWLSEAAAAELKLGEASVLRLIEGGDAVEALTRRDDYITQMSSFDRQVRLQTDRDVSEAELLPFISQNVLPWEPADVERITPIVDAVAKKLEPWKLRLPTVVQLIKTTGREEGNAAYCRGSSIVLPRTVIENRRHDLARLLTHELFHILSRHNPELRESLYASIGFKPCNEVPLPEPLRARKITNPDAPINDHFITVEHEGRAVELMCVLFSNAERYDAARGGSLFSYLTFRLMMLENDNGVRRPAVVDGQPVLLEATNVPGFAEQVGRNTRYLIHPEEILADNFVLLVDGRIDVATPRVVQEMGRILQAAPK